MHIDITARNLELTPALDVYIREKMGSLEKFIQRFEELGEVEMRATIERTTAHHHKGEVFRASADLTLPGRNLHAEEDHEDARVAIDIVRDRIHSQVEKYKDEKDEH